MFNVRLITLDHYISKPIDELYVFGNKNVIEERQEPVLRIFGATSDGFKSCVHVHGVYPYIYIPYKGGENPDRDALLIGAALDEALKISLNVKLSQFIHDVTLVSGIPLYGYHSKQRQFFKIYFYNPYHIRKASELLLSGAILGQKFQPHEAHIPYALQFMIDYNLYGMSFVTFSKVKYRRNPENPDCLMGVPEGDILSDKVKKITCSYLEVDALACDIMNRIGKDEVGMNPGLRAIWEDEKARRRDQKKNSQISVQQSHSRSSIKICATEALFKVRLNEKLKQASFQEPRIIATSDEPVHSYPAEIPETGDILEASVKGGDTNRFSRAKESIHDISNLIDERILSQISESEKEKAENVSEEDETEVDSMIGRNQKAEEAEFEDEEGVDMTQPLNIDEEIICCAAGNGDEPGKSSRDSEETFWKNMANKIFQLDGAQESSSESETETTPLASVSEDKTSGASLELSSAWSSNIMSILSEDGGCPTPSTLCQTPRTFWSNYSPNWLPQNQDQWTWNKNSAPFSDFTAKNQNEGLNLGDSSGAPKDNVQGEPYDFLAFSNGENILASAPTPFCSAESTASPPSDVLTPGSEAGSSDFLNLDSFCETLESPAKNEKCSVECKFTEMKRAFNKKSEDERQKCLQVLKTFAGKKVPLENDCDQLTLKQYIKDCEEIVSVDFKNLCNQEMIIIEYKSQNKRSLKNKYLIKPLDKFLESWNSAEKKAGDRRLPKNNHRSKIINGFNIEEGKNLRSAVINVLEKRFSDSSSVQSVSNKLTVKAMEILPNGGGGKDRSYNVNQNVISQGKIKMKLIKSQRENLEENLVEGTLKRQRSEKCFKLDLNKINADKQKENEKAEKEQGSQRESVQKNHIIGKYNKWKNLSEPDSKLISEINSSFEKYFKTIVQHKKFNRKKNNCIENINTDEKKAGRKEKKEESDCEKKDEVDHEEDNQEEKKQKTKRKKKEEEEENFWGNEKANISTMKKRRAQHVQASSDTDPVKFVTRFITAFSRMSDIPPLSITISFGNPRISVPIQVNLQPIVTSSEKEVSYFSKKQRRKVIIENVDGPADGSSSEETSGETTKLRSCGQKKSKREGYYKPLNVVIYGSPSEKKKRKVTTCGGSQEEKAKGKRGRKSFLTRSLEEMPKSYPPRGGEKEKASSENLVRSYKKSFPDGEFRGSGKLLDSGQNFIEESDGDRLFEDSPSKRRSLKLQKKKSKILLKKIPQLETETFLRSEDVVLKRIRKKISGIVKEKSIRKPFAMSRYEGVEKSGGFSCKEPSMKFKDGNGKREENMVYIPHPISYDGNSPLEGSDRASVQEERNLMCEFSQSGISPPPKLVRIVNSTMKLHASEFECEKSDSSALPISNFLIHTERMNSSVKTDEDSDSFETARSFFQERKPFLHFRSYNQIIRHNPSSKSQVNSLDWVIGCKRIRPKVKPLVPKVMVKFIFHDDVLEREENEPFYSDPRDVTRVLEMGPRVLKVKNRSMAKLQLFKSSLDILGIEERRNTSMGEEEIKRCCLVGCEDLRITPLMKPPSADTASKWFFSKYESEKLKKSLKNIKVKLVKPLISKVILQSGGCDEEVNEGVTVGNLSEEFETVIKERLLENSFLTENTKNLNETEMTLKKGPFFRIKGIKKFRALKKLTDISEEGETLENSEKLPLRISPLSHTVSTNESKRNSDNSFQIKEVTLDNSFGFSHSIENMQNAKRNETHQLMSILVMELHVRTRKNFRPDPEFDPIRALFYSITFDSSVRNTEIGILIVGEEHLSGELASGHSILHVSTERALIEKFLDLLKFWDPEILAGYEIEMHSWGYLVQRGFTLKMNLLQLLGRVQVEDFTKKSIWDFSSPGYDVDLLPKSVKHMRISGRIMLDVWRVLRHEVALRSYSFENVIYHLLHERHSRLSYQSLSHFWEHPSSRFRHIVVEHYITRVFGVIRILDQLDFINRTSELSRLFGIQFYEVLSRGSQFRVESMMLRLAKPLNYVPTSPSVTQRAAMRAPASLPLILEPESLFYSDPIVVLDFQSLYPSIIIAYNYCFSTCLGRIENLGGREPFEFGCTHLQISPEELKSLENDLSISPAGVAFVKANVRKGILPTMLEEILETRLMIKKSMREIKENKILQKILFARQLGLKLIANVTYGYTAANFSGRMPCIEVGDSVVSKGRETLHRAIELVKENQKWGAKVVYGDTDSIFVLIPGRTRQEAFQIGAEIAEAVTQDNPKPVKLKLEKVYQPTILQTKKRYVGYMFENADQEKPVFEAKGIETVRRDGCPAAGKILQKALQILFDTRDVSLVKKYTIRQFEKLFQGRINMHDLIFAKEYRGRNGYRPGACVPALYLAKKWMQFDKRAEPRVKERVPYVIAYGPPGVPLIKLVRSIEDLMSDPFLRINATYYITKAIIPPMQRCFSLLGVDVITWFAEMPRKYHNFYKSSWTECQKRSTISQYFAAMKCIVCCEVTSAPLCPQCEKQPQGLALRLNEKVRLWERCHEGLLNICRSCCGRPSPLECISFDCPVLFRRNQAERAVEQGPVLREFLIRYL